MSRTDFLAYLLYFGLAGMVASTHWMPALSLHVYTEPVLGTVLESYRALERATLHLTQYFVDRRRLLGRVRSLEKHNRTLRQRLYRARAARRGRSALRRFLRLPPAPTGDLLPAQVLTVNLTGWERTLRINRGRSGGARRGQPVLELAGDTWFLRGEVLSVSPRQSVVALTSDPRFRVGVWVEGVRDRQFVARGWGERGLRVDHFPRVLSVELGARVRSARASTVAPAGLTVGTVRTLTPSGASRVGRRLQIAPPPVAEFSDPLWLLVSDA